MKTYRISYTVCCAACRKATKHLLTGMGESHANWIKSLDGVMPDYRCGGCLSTSDSILRGVVVEEVGK